MKAKAQDLSDVKRQWIERLVSITMRKIREAFADGDCLPLLSNQERLITVAVGGVILATAVAVDEAWLKKIQTNPKPKDKK